MTLRSQRSQHLFVVRTWRETSDVVPADQWRGSVEHVPTGQRLHFSTLGQLMQFVATCTDWPTSIDSAAAQLQEQNTASQE